MICVENLSKNYSLRRRQVAALAGVNLSVDAGEFVAMVGPSGSGKSTLLLALGGLIHPDNGEVLIEGQSLYRLHQAQRARIRYQKIGFLFQTFHLVPYLTALENVQLALFVAGQTPACQAKRARQLLDEVGLSDRMDHKPGELSVGQQQRVALARTLANDPRLILADEPTGSLDPETVEAVMGTLHKLHRDGITIVMVTHDPTVAAQAQRRVMLRDGRIATA